MTLQDCVAGLEDLDEEATIWAAEPWTPGSAAAVEIEPEEGGVPEALAAAGLSYFLEVELAQQFVEDWEASLDTAPTEEQKCLRLIEYAENDA